MLVSHEHLSACKVQTHQALRTVDTGITVQPHDVAVALCQWLCSDSPGNLFYNGLKLATVCLCADFCFSPKICSPSAGDTADRAKHRSQQIDR